MDKKIMLGNPTKFDVKCGVCLTTDTSINIYYNEFDYLCNQCGNFERSIDMNYSYMSKEEFKKLRG